MRIIDDEKHELAPTAKELRFFASILEKDMHKKLAIEERKKFKEDLLKSVVGGTARPTKLVQSYFK